jgi:hypothetical protein
MHVAATESLEERLRQQGSVLPTLEIRRSTQPIKQHVEQLTQRSIENSGEMHTTVTRRPPKKGDDSTTGQILSDIEKLLGKRTKELVSAIQSSIELTGEQGGPLRRTPKDLAHWLSGI